MDKMNILFVASEVVPFAKSGGLADVAGALPKTLKKMGHNVIVVMPRYYEVDREKYGLTLLPGPLGVPMGAMGELWAGVYEGVIPGSKVPIYFIEHEGYFGRKGLYADDDGWSYQDNDVRFIFLSKAAMQLAKKLDFKPHILHANDWHTATLPILLNTAYRDDPQFEDTASILTIHNMQHQGRFNPLAFNTLGIDWGHFNHYEFEDFGGINMLKSGIVHCDALNTVSKKYAKEIQTGEFGWGLQDVIYAHRNKLYGIINGIDYDEWSPAVDTLIPATFDADSLAGKAECKRTLQERFGLEQNPAIPVIGLVGRMAEQKGIGLIAGSIGHILHRGAQVVMLGAGEKWAEHFFGDIAARYPGRFGCYIGYKNELAHHIEAGSDFFLMPSLFEPCGLNQIYSLRYGTLPIVRGTGGLEDTIDNFDAIARSGNGFKFYEPSIEALNATVDWALHTWHTDKKAISMLIQNGMKMRFSWEDSAVAYTDIYNLALYNKRCKRYA